MDKIINGIGKNIIVPPPNATTLMGFIIFSIAGGEIEEVYFEIIV